VEHILNRQAQIKKNILDSYNTDSIQAVSAADFIQKGKKASLGEIREWNGKKMQKTVSGWIPATSGNKATPAGKSEDVSKFEDMVDRAGKAISKFKTNKAEYSPDAVETLRASAKKLGMDLGKTPEEIDKILTQAREKHESTDSTGGEKGKYTPNVSDEAKNLVGKIVKLKSDMPYMTKTEPLRGQNLYVEDIKSIDYGSRSEDILILKDSRGKVHELSMRFFEELKSQ
jgi:hypothetical protein